uniref:GOLD domain-containing protein n=1 Tax=Seriola dumerili TaxID=41447 RepID=A0A3B4TFJ4_SERDU
MHVVLDPVFAALQEDIHTDVLVTGEYEFSEKPGTTTNLKVNVFPHITDSFGHMLYTKEKFSFTTEKEKLTPLEAKIRHFEYLSQSIANNFNYLRKQGTEMQDTNHHLHVLFLIALAVWQVFILSKGFFKAKELID